MNTPFYNDMFSLVYKAFENLYHKECICEWSPTSFKAEDGSDAYGMTTFDDDGKILVSISADIPVTGAVEVFAHELAHVVVGIDAGHGKEWEETFEAIYREYERIALEAINEKN